MDKTTEMQPIEFLEYSKRYLDYSDKTQLSELSSLDIKKIYNYFNLGKGKKNSLKIAQAMVILLDKKGIKDKTVEKFKKKFVA